MSNAAAVVSRLVNELTERRVRELLTDLLLASTVTPVPAQRAKPLAAAAAKPATRSAASKPKAKSAEPKSVEPKPANNEKTAAEQLRARRARYQQKRNAVRKAARAAKKAESESSRSQPANAAPVGASTPAGGNGTAGASGGKAFWKRAQLISPGRPWVAAARELGVNTAVAQDAFRSNKLPPNLNPGATARFLTLRPG
jgi:hypothetical protein